MMGSFSIEGKSAVKRVVALAVISLLAVAAIYSVIFKISGIAPFGDRSLTYRDGDSQYIDLLMYYKDVLAGRNSIDYTFGKSLGGSCYAVFAYYLASPLMLLVALFDKGDMMTCFDVMFLIKSGLAAFFMALFAGLRFPAESSGRKHCVVVVMLAVSYAMSQYFVSQSSNIMWLDGACLLPLIALGVSRAIKGRPCVLIVSVSMSLIFGWYTGVINCIFTVFWFIAEWFQAGGRKLFKSLLCYAAGMLSAVMISGVILIPSLYMLSGRTHGTTDLFSSISSGFIGNPLSVISNYGPGLISLKGSVSLYCGSFVLMGVMLFFVCGKASVRTKIISGILLAFTVLMFFWEPLVLLFSIFRNVESFWYRYSYLGVFVLVFIAAQYYLGESETSFMKVMLCALSFIIAGALLNISGVSAAQLQIWNYETSSEGTAGCIICGSALILCFAVTVYCCFGKENKRRFEGVALTLCALLTAFEFCLSSVILLELYSVSNATELAGYVSRETSLADYCDGLEGDGDFYRISQTSNRTAIGLNLTAEYNEALAFGFSSISSFVSAPQEEQGQYLSKLGYPFASDTLTITRASVAAADSLLGVRYVLSDYDIPQYEKLTDYATGKNVYLNPYCLPCGFIADYDIDEPEDSSDPFEYTNSMYSAMTGDKCRVYKACDYETSVSGGVTTYMVQVPDGGDALYGNIVFDDQETRKLSVNGVYETDYNCFLAPTVFMIPTDSASASVSVDSETGMHPKFYVLDESALMSAAAKLQGRAVQFSIEDSSNFHIEAHDCKSGEKLVIMLPKDRGFTVTLNGKMIETQDLCGAYQVINLDSGDNDIVFSYEIPGIKAAVAVSIAGVLLGTAAVTGYYLWRRRDEESF